MSNLTFTGTKDLKFKHNGLGVNTFLKGKKTIFNFSMVLPPEQPLTRDKQREFLRSILNAQSIIERLPAHDLTNFDVLPNQIINNDYTPFYKYTSEHIYTSKLQKGIWQLGCIEQYRTIENTKQRDEFEGQCFINMNINGHGVTSLACTGFNYLIFCGTRKKSSDLHRDSFGTKELYFPNVRSFADSVKKSIGAKRYYVQNVIYNSSKWINIDEPIMDEWVNVNDILGSRYIELINKHSLYPSLFVKPESFAPEEEVRIVFEMDKDYYKPLRFENNSLLDYVKH